MHRPQALLFAAAALTLNTASGQVTTIGPFSGDASEGFEGRTSSLGACVEDGVFGGLGALCSNQAFVTTSTAWTCTIRARSGGRLFISTVSEATFSFGTPITRFGGYFAAGHPGTPGATVTFLDESGSLIDSVEADIPLDCAWVWQGWSSETPVSQIVVRGNVSGAIGGFIGMDDMEVGSAPAAPPCFADCDTSTGAGVLDLYDVLCFQERFLAGDPYACDADTSTGAGACDILDFVAYMDSFLAGCEPNDPPATVPLDLEETVALLSSELLDLRDKVWALDDSVVTGRNARADKVRRWILAWHLSAAHSWLQAGELRRSNRHLRRFVARVDGVHPRRDWVVPGPEQRELANTGGAIVGVVDLLRETYGDGDRWRRVCKFRRGTWRFGWFYR